MQTESTILIAEIKIGMTGGKNDLEQELSCLCNGWSLIGYLALVRFAILQLQALSLPRPLMANSLKP